MRILFADDDATMRAAVKIILVGAGHEFVGAENGERALEQFAETSPDLVILDVMMPKLNGFEVCERIRRQKADTPILFLTAKGELDDKKTAYGSGCDDYMVKPFEGAELLLRIGALLRRAYGSPTASSDPSARPLPATMRLGDIEINLRKHTVTVSGTVANLTHREFQILAFLAEHVDEVITKEELVEAVWGEEYADGTVSIAVYIRHIREKIEKDPSHPVYLQTVYRVGYSLHTPEE